MIKDISFYSSITIDIQVYDDGMYAISYKGKTLLDKKDSESCKNKLQKIVNDLTNHIKFVKERGVCPARTVIFKIWNYGWQGHNDISFRNISEIKSHLCSLRSSAEFNIEVRTPYYNFG